MRAYYVVLRKSRTRSRTRLRISRSPLQSNKEAYYSTFIQENSNDPKRLFKSVNMLLRRNSEGCYIQML